MTIVSLCSSTFFFLIIPRPPPSTLFPYTTLFRSRAPVILIKDLMFLSQPLPFWCSQPRRWNGCSEYRSEEHTSELQSLRHLVCRLLLEKKKKKEKKLIKIMVYAKKT